MELPVEHPEKYDVGTTITGIWTVDESGKVTRNDSNDDPPYNEYRTDDIISCGDVNGVYTF